jgi:Protein of unknown function (DUF3570)
MRHKGAVVAVINSQEQESLCINALTTAALLLPGLLSPAAHAAEGDEVDFQYSHYQEGKRNLFYAGYNNDGGNIVVPGKSFNPIEVDSINGHGSFSLTDRVKFAFNYVQDTWGGATPVSTLPAAFGGNGQSYDTSGSVVTGATPYTITGQGELLFDKNFNTYLGDYDGNPVSSEKRTTHVMSTASPETRKQGDFKLSYDWDEAAVSVGGGISVEDDYESRFGNLGLRLDLNQKHTTLNLDLSYTNSDTNAVIDHDLYYSRDKWFYEHVTFNEKTLANTVTGTKQDWGVHAGVSQVISKSALVSADFNYTRSTGYMANPYKLTQFFYVDPAEFQSKEFVRPNVDAFLERRPEVRNQWGVGGRYVQYINPLDAALHFDYRFSADDWGIQAHTFEADWVQPLGSGWTVTPSVRYYSQDAADFYTPYVVLKEKRERGEILVNGNPGNITTNKLPSAFSSDHRLSGYGALSGGVTVTKQFAKGLTLETGFEYYTHQGSMKIGGGGEGAYADFDYWLANAALKVDLNALALNATDGGHTGHQDHHAHGVHAPAGVMFDHMLPKAGDFMVGYRYMWNSQSGNMLNGTNTVSDPAIVAGGCNGDPCYLTPDSMAMSMHMLDLMYAPTDWLTLMLMPQFTDMDMDMRRLDGAPSTGNLGTESQHIVHHSQNGHETGGIGDLGMYALFKLFDNGVHHLHATAGFSAPTADVDIKMRRNHGIDGGYIHYGMQLGSGTWDFKPSITYAGHVNELSWGAQASGTVRMEDKNKSGYALGDLFQATAWGSYNLTQWLTASLRGVYTVQGGIKGQYVGANSNSTNSFYNLDGSTTSILKFGPQDYPSSYGGKYWDVGFGLSAMVPSGDFAGNRVSVEWLQPVEDDVNGYQLERDGALSATWSMAF